MDAPETLSIDQFREKSDEITHDVLKFIRQNEINPALAAHSAGKVLLLLLIKICDSETEMEHIFESLVKGAKESFHIKESISSLLDS